MSWDPYVYFKGCSPQPWSKAKVKFLDDLREHFNKCYNDTIGLAADNYFLTREPLLANTVKVKLEGDTIKKWKYNVINAYHGETA